MKKAEPPLVKSDRAESITAEIVNTARSEPGKWFDATDEMEGRSLTGASSNLYRYAGKQFTPLDVMMRDGRLYVRWSSDEV